MPFTLAHPAAAIPLQRLRLPLLPLIVGAVAPDLEYLLYLEPHGHLGHRPIGIALFCVPAGLLLLALFDVLWRRPVERALPSGWTCRWPCHHFWPVPNLGLTVLALAVGAATHIVWDTFTHRQGWIVARYPALYEPLRTILGCPVTPRALLQHGSSILGLSLLSYWTWRAWQRLSSEADRAHLRRMGRRVAVGAGAAIALGAVVALLWTLIESGGHPVGWRVWTRWATRTAVIAMDVALLLAVVAGVRGRRALASLGGHLHGKRG